MVWTLHTFWEWMFYGGALVSGGAIGFAAGHRNGKRAAVWTLREYERLADQHPEAVGMSEMHRDSVLGGLVRHWLDVVDPPRGTGGYPAASRDVRIPKAPPPLSWKDRL